MPEQIELGQRWVSRDRRDNGRTVTVVAVDLIGAASGSVTVKSVRKSRMRASTLLARYRLLAGREVEQASQGVDPEQVQR